ncbi:AAA family ATPase [Rhizobium jaguaris]|uniref:ATP-binding protein n=1 Tax=Rhizobium jaguaris TaxID=1312183 RepID=A0A387FL65_9HYPH|nr:AAA family ATPase [Rhizobium jaguaris]AYG57995.1 ATP-binding protein [Rhizobium jaguaris]
MIIPLSLRSVIQRQSPIVKKRVLQLVQVVAPDVTEITLLQISGQPSLFASFNNNDDMLLPISMLGDGLSAILSAGLAIIDCQDGVVFLDEFDGAIHYSKLKQIWAELIKLAKEMNVQVFAATHSREAIKAISDASVISALQERLIYLRIDKVDDKTKATTYLQSELEDALSDNWEVR